MCQVSITNRGRLQIQNKLTTTETYLTKLCICLDVIKIKGLRVQQLNGDSQHTGN